MTGKVLSAGTHRNIRGCRSARQRFAIAGMNLFQRHRKVGEPECAGLRETPPLGFSGLYHFVQQPRPILFAERKTRHWTGAQRADSNLAETRMQERVNPFRHSQVLARDRGAGSDASVPGILQQWSESPHGHFETTGSVASPTMPIVDLPGAIQADGDGKRMIAK